MKVNKKNKYRLFRESLLLLTAFTMPLSSLAATTAPLPGTEDNAPAGPTVTSPASSSSSSSPSAASSSASTPSASSTTSTTSQTVTVTNNVYKGEIYKNGIGLKPEDQHLVNQGRFADLINKLAAGINYGSKASRESAWLGFSYLYLQKCDELNQLAKSFDTSNASTEPDINLILIQTFAYLCNKQVDLAEKKLQTIPAVAMNDAFVNYAFATLSGKQGKPQVAVAYTKRAVELAPQFAWGYRTIAFIQERSLNQIKEAEINYAKALSIEPKLSEAASALIMLYLANNQFDEAVSTAQTQIKHDPRNAANYRQLADIYVRQLRLNEAAEQLKKAIALDPDNAQYHRLLAFVYRQQSNFDAAIAEQKITIDHSNQKSADLIDLAAIQLNANKQNDAIESLKQAVGQDPQNVIALSQLTDLLVQTGKFDELATELNKAATKMPKNEIIKLRLGDALAAAKQTDKAIGAYKEAANLNPNNPDPHTKIAAIYVSKKDYENAAKEYTRALNINSNSVPNLVALGGCEAQMDDYLKAEAAFVTALALHQLTQPADSTVPPTRVEIIRGLAALLFKEGRYADAASQFVALMDIDKNPADLNINRFMAAQAIALRDLSKESLKQLAGAYANLSPEEKTGQKINYVDTLLRAKRYDQALSLLNEFGKDSANGAFYQICLSDAYIGLGNLDKAETAAHQAITICDKDNSPHSDAFCQLGDVLYAKDDLAGAEKNANNALGINKNAFRAYVLLGKIAMKRNQPKLASEAANKALEIDPYFIDAYLLLGEAQLLQEDFKNAAATYRKAVNLYPGLLHPHEALLIVLTKIGNKEEITAETILIEQIKGKQ